MSYNGHYCARQAFPGQCGEVRGSADGLFPPGAASASTLQLFSTDLCRLCTALLLRRFCTGLCRPLQLQREATATVHGIPAVAFRWADISVQNM